MTRAPSRRVDSHAPRPRPVAGGGVPSRLRASWRPIATSLALSLLLGCVSVRYQRPGRDITPRPGETLVFGRVRFFHDGREFFPWNASLVAPAVVTNAERHLWLLRLGRRAVSAEVHPDPDGSVAIWLARGDYALIGSTRRSSSGAPPYEVMALLRVPAGRVAAYTGELSMRTERREGGHLSYGELGEASVSLVPIDLARVALEQRLGTLPEAPVESPWCAGDRLPGFDDPGLATRAKELLDRGCATGAGAPARSAPAFARVPPPSERTATSHVRGEIASGSTSPSAISRRVRRRR
jgi:hypothetical protein